MRFALPLVLLAAGCSAGLRAPDGVASDFTLGLRTPQRETNQFGGVDYEPVSHRAPELDAERASADRKIIFHGSMALQVGDPDVAEREVRAIVEAAKGWVHKIEAATMTLRVPADQFDETMAKLAKVGRVLDRKVAGTDVTEEYRDLELRLKNAEAVRARLTALLEKAKDVKEALEVERELGRVTEEIERLKGKLKAMADEVAYSTIAVSLQRGAPASTQRGPQFPFPWVLRLGIHELMWFHR